MNKTKNLMVLIQNKKMKQNKIILIINKVALVENLIALKNIVNVFNKRKNVVKYANVSYVKINKKIFRTNN